MSGNNLAYTAARYCPLARLVHCLLSLLNQQIATTQLAASSLCHACLHAILVIDFYSMPHLHADTRSKTVIQITDSMQTPQGGGRGCLHVGHSIFTSIHLCKHLLWKKWPQGVTIRAGRRCTSSAFMQITHSTPASPVSMSPCSLQEAGPP